jgi:hypothetical protein
LPPPPSSDEQENVKAKASPKVAANTILESCVLIVFLHFEGLNVEIGKILESGESGFRQ